jgi:hypothetical protein
MHTQRLCVGAAALLLSSFGVSCQGGRPASVEVNVHGPSFSSSTDVPMQVVVKGAGGEVLNVTPVLSVDSGGVAVVTQSGAIRCLKSGRTTVRATAGEVSGTGAVECNLVEKVYAPGQLRLTVGQRAKNPGSAVNADGEMTLGLNVTMESSDTGVVRVEDNHLVGAGLGTAQITFRAADKSATTEVFVSKKLDNVTFQVPDGSVLNHPLGAGTFKIEGQVTGNAITLTWLGGEPTWRDGDTCQRTAEGHRHYSTCSLPQGGAVVLSNDSNFFGGDVASGVLRITQLP